MSLSTIQSIRFPFFILLVLPVLVFGNQYPDWQSISAFNSDLRNSALAANLPNQTGEDYYLGISPTVIASSNQTLMPGIRMGLYPTLGYNLWTEFAKWPGETNNFAVGIGVQVEVQSENPARRQAIGLSWNKAFANDFTQRDVRVHALYGWAGEKFGYGVLGMLNMHHVLIEDSRGFADYDETFFQAAPYINWMMTEQSRISICLPLDIEGAAISLGYEKFLGKRD